MATSLSAKELAGNITVHITIPRLAEWCWRMGIASWLIRLACLIMWTNLVIEES